MIDGDDELRTRMIAHQDQRLARLEAFDIDGFLDRVVRRAAGTLSGTTVQVQGPFETSYSLAILNRELALHLDQRPDLDVSIYATEGPGDYTPNPVDLAAHPDATRLYERRTTAPFPEVAIRQMFPPRVADSTAGMTFQYFGWEESRLPASIVDDFNRHLDGIGTMSTYVKEILAGSGVSVPMHVVGVGVHQPDPDAICEAPELEDLRAKRFLHISSAFPRKGVDVLLRGWFETFDADDDVSLVLKTFPNPHNDVGAQLAALRAEFPAAHTSAGSTVTSIGRRSTASTESRRATSTPRGARASVFRSPRRCWPACRSSPSLPPGWPTSSTRALRPSSGTGWCRPRRT